MCPGRQQATRPEQPLCCLCTHFVLAVHLSFKHACTSFMNTYCKLSGIYISNQMRSGREKPLCRGVRRSQGHGGGFHIISVKCFYLTAVRVSDKLMSAPVFELYYEIIFQTRPLKLDQSYIVGWLKVAGLASITRRDSEGQCKEQCLALALSVLSHVWQAGHRAADWIWGPAECVPVRKPLRMLSYYRCNNTGILSARMQNS